MTNRLKKKSKLKRLLIHSLKYTNYLEINLKNEDMEDLWRKLSALLKDRQMERPVFTLQMSQYEKRFFPYLASRFNAISIKVPTGFLHRTQQAERKRRIIRML